MNKSKTIAKIRLLLIKLNRFKKIQQSLFNVVRSQERVLNVLYDFPKNTRNVPEAVVVMLPNKMHNEWVRPTSLTYVIKYLIIFELNKKYFW